MMTETGLGQNALGAAAGISSAVMSRWVQTTARVAKRSPELLTKLATKHGYSPTWLITDEGPPKAAQQPAAVAPGPTETSEIDAVAAALAGLYDPEAIEAMRREPHGPRASDAAYLASRVLFFQQMRDAAKDTEGLEKSTVKLKLPKLA